MGTKCAPVTTSRLSDRRMQHVWKVHLQTRFWSPEGKEIFKHDENQNTTAQVCVPSDENTEAALFLQAPETPSTDGRNGGRTDVRADA